MAIFNVTIEVNNDLSLEEMEELIEAVLVDNGIDCTFEVTQKIMG